MYLENFFFLELDFNCGNAQNYFTEEYPAVLFGFSCIL